MIYDLQTSCVYGPVNSRRLGRSLGVNLLPHELKFCTFDCVYCHYGNTDVKDVDSRDPRIRFPSSSDVTDELREAFEEYRVRKDIPDFITFSGNGEPTLHPQFGRIVDEVKALRDEYLPDVPVAILSNSTTVHLPHIRDALMRLDKRIMKLDGGDEETFRAVNRPHPSVTLAGVIDGLCLLRGISIQSAFMTGSVDNVRAEHVEAWIQALQRIQPEDIQMYTIDRPSADGLIEKVQRSVLENIAREVKDRTGISATVY